MALSRRVPHAPPVVRRLRADGQRIVRELHAGGGGHLRGRGGPDDLRHARGRADLPEALDGLDLDAGGLAQVRLAAQVEHRHHARGLVGADRDDLAEGVVHPGEVHGHVRLDADARALQARAVEAQQASWLALEVATDDGRFGLRRDAVGRDGRVGAAPAQEHRRDLLGRLGGEAEAVLDAQRLVRGGPLALLLDLHHGQEVLALPLLVRRGPQRPLVGVLLGRDRAGAVAVHGLDRIAGDDLEPHIARREEAAVEAGLAAGEAEGLRLRVRRDGRDGVEEPVILRRALGRLEHVVHDDEAGLDEQEAAVPLLERALVHVRVGRVADHDAEGRAVEPCLHHAITAGPARVLVLAVDKDGVVGAGEHRVVREVRAAEPVVVARVDGELLAVGVDDEGVLIFVLVAGPELAGVHGHGDAVGAAEQARVEHAPTDEAVEDGLG